VKPGNRIDAVLQRLTAAAGALNTEVWWTSLRDAMTASLRMRDPEPVVRVLRFTGTARPGRPVGSDRARELAVNAFAPWCMLCGGEEALPSVPEVGTLVYYSTGGAGSNRATRSFDMELGGLEERSSGMQQGMIELHQRYCSAGGCGDCLIAAAIDSR
jgi:hypothetical protein